MEQFVLKVKSTFMNKDFFKFLIIGVVNTFNSTVFSILYGLMISANLAFISGYVTSLCIAYILNSKFIFYKELTFIGLVKFAISYVPNFIIQNMIVLLVYNIMGLPSVVAYIVAACIGIPVTFLCVKLFAFGKSKKM